MAKLDSLEPSIQFSIHKEAQIESQIVVAL